MNPPYTRRNPFKFFSDIVFRRMLPARCVENLFMSFFVPRGLKARNKLLTKMGKHTRGEVVSHRTVKFLKVEMVGESGVRVCSISTELQRGLSTSLNFMFCIEGTLTIPLLMSHGHLYFAFATPLTKK